MSAEAFLLRVPLETPRGDAIQKFEALELPCVHLRDAAGNEGLGFGYTIGKGGTTVQELLRQELLPLLKEKDSRRPAQLNHLLFQSIHALTPGCIASTAVAAIDIALWDLAARRQGLPLHLLLGGARDSVPVYNTHVGWLNRPLAEMRELCVQAVQRDGFRALKLKVGKPDAREDEQRVAKIREAVGPEVRLMIDANQSWTFDEAVRRLPLLEKYDLTWVEEPLAATDVQGYAELARRTAIPIAGGESLYDPAYFYENIRQGSLSILQPDVVRIGGITRALEVCHLAQARGLRVSPHVSPELSVVVACAVPNSFFVEYIPQMEPVLEHPVAVEKGKLRPLKGSGHGIRLKAEALQRYEVAA